MSDTAFLAGIVILFVSLGVILPFVHSAFGETATNVNAEGIEFAQGQSSISVLGIIVSITTMFFWTFGNIPAILDTILFVPLRIMFFVLLFKLVRGVGG